MLITLHHIIVSFLLKRLPSATLFFIFIFLTLWFITFSDLKSFYIFNRLWYIEEWDTREERNWLQFGWLWVIVPFISENLEKRVIFVVSQVCSCTIAWNRLDSLLRLFSILNISLKEKWLVLAVENQCLFMYRKWNFIILAWSNPCSLMLIGFF